MLGIVLALTALVLVLILCLGNWDLADLRRQPSACRRALPEEPKGPHN